MFKILITLQQVSAITSHWPFQVVAEPEVDSGHLSGEIWNGHVLGFGKNIEPIDFIQFKFKYLTTPNIVFRYSFNQITNILLE